MGAIAKSGRWFVSVWLVALATPCLALEATNVLVIYNGVSADGADIAGYYAQAHPGVRTLALTGVGPEEQISYDVYLNTIRPQVRAALTGAIDCIVTTKGLPLRIDNPGSAYRYSSLESELTRIDAISTRAQMSDQAWYLANSPSRNPYWRVNAGFSYAAYSTRLAARLDGFAVADVKAAIDRAGQAVLNRPGYSFILDDDPDAPARNADRMPALAAALSARGLAYAYDGTDAFVTSAPGAVLGYVSHGVNSGAAEDYLTNAAAGLAFSAAPGAVFHTWESYNAYTFAGDGTSPRHQGLIAQWLARGGTAGVGQVEEPGASSDNVTNEDRLFQMLLDGYSFGEAAWNATRQLSYVNTVVGDPLMQFRQWIPGDADLDGDVDALDLAGVEAACGTIAGSTGYDLLADMNADGRVNADDVLFVEQRLTAGPASVVVIPEPATLVLFSLCGAFAALRRRK